MSKTILDACCGGRMFWFDKNNPDVVFADIRSESLSFKCYDKIRTMEVKPDIIMDFTKMPFADGSFKMVVFDPPHLNKLGDTSYMAKKYGKLKPTWHIDIQKGLSECMRVLEVGGTLIFKWNESQIKTSDILKLTPTPPPIWSYHGAAGENYMDMFYQKMN